MPFSIIQENIINMKSDAIVNATDKFFSGKGQVDYAIHQEADPQLREDCNRLGEIQIGEAKVTLAYNIPAKYIIHTSGPNWTGGSSEELTLLENCYKNSINLARNKKCKSIAFPIISSHGKGFPKELALIIAINTIREILQENDNVDVYLLIFTNHKKNISNPLLLEIKQTIENYYKPSSVYTKENLIPYSTTTSLVESDLSLSDFTTAVNEQTSDTDNINELIESLIKHPTQKNLDKVPIEENFSKMLSRIISERKIKNSTVYDELGMSNVGFWKLLNGKSNPSKMSVWGLAITFRLSIEETKKMLMKAGYAINPSSIFDVIVSGLIQNKYYDRFKINELLYALDLPTLPG